MAMVIVVIAMAVPSFLAKWLYTLLSVLLPAVY